ncbi:hypothetical protein [Desulfosporosinus sp. BG]|uniref:hypothetical protein n=1 Tax=Desulfosporosinus sp. BG TaxID=1633135 RepID=UPI00083A072C|nr:hypothetical protein [Desulfosporosinus sp. BG]ODA40088.1 hypothetical protein DSBG_3122 [Desulfosporosinus sp. BG]
MNYLTKPMKKILLSLSLLLLTLLFATNTLAASGELEQDAGPYHVTMQINPENLLVNQAGTMTIIIKDKVTGQPVTGAKVMMSKSTMLSSSTGDSSMAGMNMSSSMDKQEGTAMQEQSSMSGMAMGLGSYMVEGMMFNQPGQWTQSITITSSLGESTVNFPITISKSGPNLVLIGSVAGVVVIVGLVAALLKRKKN